MKQKLYFLLSIFWISHYSSGQNGSHLNFDGTNDFVVSANVATNNTQNQTYQVWFRIPSIPTNGDRIIQRGSDGSGGWSVQLDVTSTGRLSAGISAAPSDTFVTGTTVLTPNTWYLATFVFENNNSLRLYLNSTLEASLVIGNRTLRNSDNRLRVGTGNIASEFFRGDVDEVRVWNIALSQTEIMNSMNCELQGNETGLALYYKLNQGIDQANNTTITNALDATTNNNNGTLTNFTLNGVTSNWLAGSPISTPGNPTVSSSVTYYQGETASALSATTGGTGLLWYTVPIGGVGSTTAPTPSTASVGSTSYWVSSINANGCESARVEIVVTVNPQVPATHLNFDGINDFVVTTNTVTNNTENQTFQAWIKIPSLPVASNRYRIFQRGIDGTGAGWSIALDVLDSGLLQALYVTSSNTGSSVNGTTVLTPDTWYHVTMVFENNNSIRVYLNGLPQATLPIGNITLRSSDSKIRIGRGNLISEYFKGNIDDVRIWNKVLSQDYIMNTMNCELPNGEANLVVYYKFNQGFANVDNTGVNSAIDATSNANNGILTNIGLNGTTSNWLAGSTVTTGLTVPGVPTITSPVVYNQGDTASALAATTGTNGTGLLWYTTATGGAGSTTAPIPTTSNGGSTSYWVSSTNGCESARVEIVVTVNSAATHLNFDGVNDSVVSANAITSNTENQTYQVWFRIPSIPTNSDRILQRGNDGTGGWSVQIDVNATGKLSAGISATPDTFLTGTTVLTPNTWYHATFVFENNNSLRLYLNGILEASVAIGNRTLRNSDNRLRIGIGNIASEYFNGDIDEVRVWNKVLNATDILNTMNCELQTSEIGLKVYYKFNQGFENVNNSSVTSATDSSGNGNNGSLTNFALNGATSNWLVGSTITTGNTCATLGNSDFENSPNISIYPNPSTGIFNIVSQQNISVEIYDLLGKLVYNQSLANGTNSIDISNFNTGIYLLKVTDFNGKTESHKLIKN